MRTDTNGNLLPPVTDMRAISRTVAAAVARQARDEGLCAKLSDEAIDAAIASKIWEPVYRPYRRLKPMDEAGYVI